MTARYTQLHDGSWGVWVNGSIPNAGDVVQVTKRDGGVTTEIIKGVLREDRAPAGHLRALCTIRTPASFPAPLGED